MPWPGAVERAGFPVPHATGGVPMLRASRNTKLSAEKVFEKAQAFFGPGGLGLTVAEGGGNGCLSFEGGGGFVTVEVCQGDRGSEVTVESREWDYQAKEFLRKL